MDTLKDAGKAFLRLLGKVAAAAGAVAAAVGSIFTG